ncbi:Ig-like domain-containing protein, partial [Dietzia sp. NPDC055343]
MVTLDDSFVPVPGGEYLQGDFLARNRCDAPASLQVYAGAWELTDGGSGVWRADLGDAAGSPVALTGPYTQDDWGVLINEAPALTDQVIPVTLYIGIPAGETAQSYSINPAWSFSLEPTDVVTVPDAPAGLQAQPGSPTTRDRVVVTGTAEPGSTVNVSVDGQVRCTTTATPEGRFSCDVGTLSRRNHQVSATASNSAGASDPANPLKVTVRNTGPTGWGSLDDLLNWGSLGGLGSLGSVGSSDFGSGNSAGSGAVAGSSTGSIAASSLGVLGSATTGSGAASHPADPDRHVGAGAGAAGGPEGSAPGGTAAGAGQAGTPDAAAIRGHGEVGTGESGPAGGSPSGAGATGGAGAGHGQAPGGRGATTPGTPGQPAAGGGAAGAGTPGGGAAGGGAGGGQAAITGAGATTGGHTAAGA